MLTCSFGHNLATAQSFDLVPHEPHPQSTENGRRDASSSSEENSSMWPYPTYKPISWERYYARDIHDSEFFDALANFALKPKLQQIKRHRHLGGISLTSGIAVGITIGVFFAVFLLTFGCRLYSQRSETLRRLSTRSSHASRALGQRRLSVSDFLTCTTPPPPSYDVAIRIPPIQGTPPMYSPREPTSDSCAQGNARPA